MVLTEEDRKNLNNRLKEISGSFTRIEGEREFIKEAIVLVAKNLNIEKKIVRKLAKGYHKDNIAVEYEQIAEIVSLYETLKN